MVSKRLPRQIFHEQSLILTIQNVDSIFIFPNVSTWSEDSSWFDWWTSNFNWETHGSKKMTTWNKSAMKRTTFQQEYLSQIHLNLICVDEVTITRASFDRNMRYLAYDLTWNNLQIDSLMKVHHFGDGM